MNFGLGIQITKNRRLSAEGFLYCENCCIARIGGREYPPDQMPQVQPKDGVVTVIRAEEALFNEVTIASFENKPACLEHPPGVEMFDASNWKEFCVGFMRNVRKGEGENAGCLVADIYVFDSNAVESIMSGKTEELSIGYRSVVKDIGNGIGLEGPLLGNHVAIVPKGRCGSLCAIKDSASIKGEKAMPELKLEEATAAQILEAIKALSEQVNSIGERVGKLESTKLDSDPAKQDSQQKTEPPKAEPPKKDEAPVTLTSEQVQAMLKEMLDQREAAQIADAAVVKDAATVAPALDKSTPDLAMAALSEFAKTDYGQKYLQEFGGLASVKKDSASMVLKSCAAALRTRAETEAIAIKDSQTDPEGPGFFEQAAKLWEK